MVELEGVLRELEVGVSPEKVEQFERDIARFLQRKGFEQGEEYWENKDVGGLIFYARKGEGNVDGSKVFYFTIASLLYSQLNVIPPLVTLIEQAIYNHELRFVRINRKHI